MKNVWKVAVGVMVGLVGMVGVTNKVNAQEVAWVDQYGGTSHVWGMDIAIKNNFVYQLGQSSGVVYGFTGSGSILLRKLDLQGNIIWAFRYGGDVQYATSYKVAVDNAGNVYIVGMTGRAFPGYIQMGLDDAFVLKINSLGVQEWVRQFGFSGQTIANGVEVDDLGGIYVGGNGTNPSNNNADSFIRKYNSDGDLIWVTYVGTVAQHLGMDMNENGDIYFVGRFPINYYIVKYNRDGVQQWVRTFSAYRGGGENVKALPNGVVFTSSNIARVLSYGMNVETIVRFYDENGNAGWERKINNGDDSIYTFSLAEGITSDAENNIYVLSTLGIPNSYGWLGGFIVRKYKIDGTESWTKLLGTLKSDTSLAIDIDTSDNLYLGGSTFGMMSDPLSNYQTLNLEAFIIKLLSPNHPSIASAGLDVTVPEGFETTFSGLGSTDPDGIADIMSYNWDFGDGQYGSGVSASHVYADDGIYTVTLTVMDTAGHIASDTAVVTVNNMAPVVGNLSSMSSVLPGITVTTSAGFSDAGVNDAHTASFDWGDGNSSVGTIDSGVVSGSHAYTTPGVYTVVLTVTDGDGGSRSTTTSVAILTPAQATQNLVNLVQTYNLQQGITNSLDAKLDAALGTLDDLNQNNNGAAINALQAFINAVEAQRGSHITDAQADQLIYDAQQILNNL